MTPERARAYGAVMRMLRVLSPSKLQPAQREYLRTAADALVFSSAQTDDQDVRATLDNLASLARTLLDSGSWPKSQVRWLMDDMWACGPASLGDPAVPDPRASEPTPTPAADTARDLERAL